MSVRRFVIAWTWLQMGGSVIYEGGLEPAAIRKATESDLLQLLKGTASSTADVPISRCAGRQLAVAHRPGISASAFKRCLIPVGCGPVCLDCRRIRWAPPL